MIPEGRSDLTRFASQYGEDAFLVAHGHVPERGVFVDVGAGDPVRFSNSYYFEQRGWSGVCIDADPKQVEMLKRTRSCAVEWAAVTSLGEEVDLLQCEDPDYSTTLGHLPGVAAKEGWQYTVTRVPAKRLDAILASHGIRQIDLLSVDTEGSELDVCDSLDWDSHEPRVVVIEYATRGLPPQDRAIRDYFRKLPYRLIHYTSSNLVFVRTNLPRIMRRWPAFRVYAEARASQPQATPNVHHGSAAQDALHERARAT